jgi:hypothetical protein
MLMKYRGFSYQLNASTVATIDAGISTNYRSLEFPTTQLKYRGVSYQVKPHNIEMVGSGVFAKYRGVLYQIPCPKQVNLN